jgi:UDP-N-acetyl-D-mannosaminuronic acid transferase (WecB/TagA/CpsF family)
MKNRILDFKGINFYDADYNFVIKKIITNKGYLVIPAASSLSSIVRMPIYKKALKNSEVAIFDSGFFCFCLMFLKFKIFKKFSGYKFMKYFLLDKKMKKKKILSLDPTLKDSELNYSYLKSRKFKFVKNYTCPMYNPYRIEDKQLINLIKKYKPNIILINIAGGVQEPLAMYIENKLNFRITSICSGAAISFFTGTQAPINDIIDNLYLGWFARLLYKPQSIIRIISSLSLFKIVHIYKVKIKYI